MGNWLSIQVLFGWTGLLPAVKEQSDYIEHKKKLEWIKLQDELKMRMIEEDTELWQRGVDDDFPDLKFVAGLDISFVKGDEVNACAALVVLNFPDLEVVYEDCRMMKLTEPYIAGFLAFRESPIYVDLYERLLRTSNVRPQLLLVDGNGKMHCRGFGIASHLGVLLDTPTVGVAKTLYHVDGIENDQRHKDMISRLENPGDSLPLVGDSGTVYGAALRTGPGSKNPVYVSVGHRISLQTSLRVTLLTSRHRIPEPTRQADIRSRDHLRQRSAVT